MSDDPDIEYCLVSKELIEDRMVSAKAKAMYALLCSFPQGTNYSLSILAEKLNMRRETAARLIKELEELGYIESSRARGTGGRTVYVDYQIHPRSTF